MPQSKEVPARAFEALASLQQNLAGDVSRYRFGVGLKRTGGQVLDEVSLVVYVPKKLPASEVPQSELIPPEHDGYRTDVVELQPILIADASRYDRLQGGIEISPIGVVRGVGLLHVERGTLGCVVRRRLDGQKLLLTCAHVASHSDDNGNDLHDAVDQDIFQPSDGEPTASVVGTCIAANDVLDAAIILPNATRGLTCSIRDIGPVRGQNTIELWNEVKKRGRTTELTSGLVVSIVMGPGNIPTELEFAGFPFGQVRVADHGDSGSAVVNNEQEVVGLLYAITDETGTNALATLIDPIRDAFKVDVAVTPIISSITPNSAVITALGPIVIDGIGFDTPVQVFFGNTPAAVLQQTTTRLEVFPVPMLVAATVDVKVVNKWDDASEPSPTAKFHYLPIA